MTNFNELVGKTITEIDGLKEGSELVKIKCLTGEVYKMYHDVGCCESVFIEDIVGDVNDILNSQILIAEERKDDSNNRENSEDSHTWTFYELATIKGSITIRWYGSSNGFYSETAAFEKINCKCCI
jgi:hypothetical protein